MQGSVAQGCMRSVRRSALWSKSAVVMHGALQVHAAPHPMVRCGDLMCVALQM